MKDHHGPGALVSEVWPDDRVDGAALELVTELSRRSINTLSGTKRILFSGMESAHLEATVRSESQSQVLSNYWPNPESPSRASIHDGSGLRTNSTADLTVSGIDVV